MSASDKLAALRKEMKARGVDCVYVPSDDFHQSEYVGDYFKARAYISGFTGSAGTLVVFADEAYLFTDGRYYLQAERQLEGSTITLMRQGSEGVPSVTELLKSKLASGMTLALDGRCVSASFAESLSRELDGVTLVTDVDFPGLIWSDRPPMPSAPIWALDEKYCGRSHTEKLSDLRAELAKAGCDALVLSSLCDIAWLYNLRGSDVECTPVFMAYSIITKDADILFANLNAARDVTDKLARDGVTLRDYNDFYPELNKLSGLNVMLEKSAVSISIVHALSNCALVDSANPTKLMKAKKNPTELKNLRLCHIADGLAVTRLMIELKFGDREFDEISVDEYLWQLRREAAERVGVTIMGKSFDTIAAFGANAAMMHYSPKPGSCAKIDRSAAVPMLLVDSGGQYLEGTTDITRTFVLGNIPDEVKMHYTLTACGMLRLLNLVFMDGAAGSALDIVCREPLWERGIDYRCGTGHGVGYLLSVHEGPNRFHWRSGDAKLEEGMITTDEPGVYIDGSHGIRIENELVTTKGVHNEYGQFMRFENLTFCPIDRDGIDSEYMDRSDLDKLNAYHKSVYDTLSPYLCENEREKLAYLTQTIS